MASAKRKIASPETFQAVFENGVFRPLQPVRLKEKSRVTVTLCGKRKWRNDFERLMRRMSRRTRAITQKDIEAEVTQARAEVKARRRAPGRSA
jgi:predicted DNA-binding antitoxin AbrB/MazE fold protein